MTEQFSRTAMLLGEDALEQLSKCRVAVFGLGGVGGYAVEALIRGGIGAVDLIDHDRVSPTNLNRQLYATHRTIGEYKVDAAAKRIADINPHAAVRTYRTFYMPDTSDQFDLKQFDYIVDAIDTVTGKLELISNAYQAHTPIISSMGTGNKLDPTAFEVADIYSTSVCPLAKVMRRELKKRGILSLKVVYSKEIPIKPSACSPTTAESSVNASGRHVPGSVSFVPPVAGLIIAGTVIQDLLKTRCLI
ncbi:MAG: ThiF family adenylyltransferase [Lachnospiraceae bacterium]